MNAIIVAEISQKRFKSIFSQYDFNVGVLEFKIDSSVSNFLYLLRPIYTTVKYL